MLQLLNILNNIFSNLLFILGQTCEPLCIGVSTARNHDIFWLSFSLSEYYHLFIFLYIAIHVYRFSDPKTTIMKEKSNPAAALLGNIMFHDIQIQLRQKCHHKSTGPILLLYINTLPVEGKQYLHDTRQFS